MAKDTVFKSIGASNHAEGERQSEDFYASDRRAVVHILKKMPELCNCNLIVEPCAGNGVMADAIKEYTNKNVDCYDIIKRREDIIVADYFDLDIKNKYDLIITNPPYKKDTKKSKGLTSLVVKMLDDVKPNGYVALLLKTLHLESQDRYNKIFKTMPPECIYVYAPRISCYKNDDYKTKQGAISYSWFVWHKNEYGEYNIKSPRLDWISEL